MRNAFAEEITSLAGQDEKLVLLSGDIGNRLFDGFKERFGPRFINCGVAEANMTGVAAGLALSGMRPVSYTIAAFNTHRCMEQIRVDLCYHNLPVTVVGVGGGLSYAGLGFTHHANEDLGALRLLPNMSVLCPADAFEVQGALRAATRHDGPVYIRIGKKGEASIHRAVPDFKIGRAIRVSEGSDVCILGVGTILPNVMAAAKLLAGSGVSASVYSFPCVKPLDKDVLAKAAENFPLIVTVEEHSIIGGVGSAVAEWMMDTEINAACSLLRIGLPDSILHEGGGQNYARERLGLGPQTIAERTMAHLNGAKS